MALELNQNKRTRGRSNIVGIDKGMGPLEAQIARAVSELPSPVTVREVCDALDKGGYFAYQGILNCMNRLVMKGILERNKQGMTYYYTPLVDMESLAAQVVANVLNCIGGAPDRIVCLALGIDPEAGTKKLAELRQRMSKETKK